LFRQIDFLCKSTTSQWAKNRQIVHKNTHAYKSSKNELKKLRKIRFLVHFSPLCVRFDMDKLFDLAISNDFLWKNAYNQVQFHYLISIKTRYYAKFEERVFEKKLYKKLLVSICTGHRQCQTHKFNENWFSILNKMLLY